jgi:hypothetical protein
MRTELSPSAAPRPFAWREFLRSIRSADRSGFAGLIDFSYQHYALGDALTTEIILACEAIDHGCDGIDLYLIIDPLSPATAVQRFITAQNYLGFLDDLFPAFLATPMLRSIHVLRDRSSIGMAVLSLVASRAPHWPSFWRHLGRRARYPMSHHTINRFHARHGDIPRLSAPRGYRGWARRFIEQHYADRFRVVINPRQSRLTSVPATVYRDAPLAEWYHFIEEVGQRHPDVHFFMVGGFAEWEPRLLAMDNVSIPRAFGLTLAHELALLDACDLFMGTSSGFATMATFSRTPYLITSIEPGFAPFAGVSVGAERYLFAQQHQRLLWHQEDRGVLAQHFELVYAAGRRRDHRDGTARPAR